MAARGMDRRERGAGGTSFASKYRILLIVWALGLVILSSTMLGGEDKEIESFDTVEPSTRGAASGGGGGGVGGSRPAKTVQPAFVKDGHRTCLRNGTCYCDRGYSGNFCEEAICQQGCYHGKCLRPGYCTCEDGYKGRSCDEPVCTKPCAHGKCVQPDHCKCDDGWFGLHCERQCENGHFIFREQRCDCSQGWFGRDCNRALCNITGCVNGECVRPEVCRCFSGWSGGNCTEDQVASHADDLMEGLAVRIRHLPALTVHKGDEHKYYQDSWRYIRKWTAHLQPQWKFGRTRFTEGVPVNDTLYKYLDNNFARCAVVGNSGGLLRGKAGAMIDDHDAVLRYNNAPTRTFEDSTGTKTTFKLLNRKQGDALLEQTTLHGDGERKKKGRHKPTWLLWRAESYHYYTMLRKKFPDEPIFLLAPEFLIPAITMYKTAMKRMEALGIKWEGGQSAPTGFVGILFMLQICDHVTIFGFDSPTPRIKIRYHYFDKMEPFEAHSTEFEYNLLRLLHAYGAIRVCIVEDLDRWA